MDANWLYNAVGISAGSIAEVERSETCSLLSNQNRIRSNPGWFFGMKDIASPTPASHSGSLSRLLYIPWSHPWFQSTCPSHVFILSAKGKTPQNPGARVSKKGKPNKWKLEAKKKGEQRQNRTKSTPTQQLQEGTNQMKQWQAYT